MVRLTSRTKRGVLAAAVAAVGCLYYFFDPAGSAWMPKCVFHALTGWECPGCGSQRMLHALLHGDLPEAWRANGFLMCMLPLLALMAFAAVARESHPRLYMRLNSLPVIIAISVAIAVWGILRNLPNIF